MAERARRRKYSRTRSNSSSSVDPKPEDMGKPRSDSSPGGGKDPPEKKKVRPKRERWLLTRKTWRYMADAGRKLIPEGLQNRPENVPKIEAYFQEVCQKEPRFLLWRKQSYPGAIGFRHRGRSRGGRKKMGGSCRDKTSSADEAEDIKKGSGGSGSLTPQLTRKLGSRLDLKKLKEEFLLGTFNPLKSHQQPQQSQSTVSSPEEESNLFLETLEMYLKEKPTDPKTASTSKSALNHEELLDKLRAHLATIERVATDERLRSVKPTSTHFEGDHMQKMLLETIRRHFGKSTNRERVISDMLTDRKSLEKLYFDLRRTRGFKSGRRSGDSVGGSSFGGYSAFKWVSSWRPSDSGSPLHYQDLREEEGSDDDEEPTNLRPNVSSYPASPPPVIEVEEEVRPEKSYATQTEAIPANVLVAIQEELAKIKLKEAEEQEPKEEPQKGTRYSRRSSVTDNDDVSRSVGDTINRYLRMVRKQSIDKADRFKRVNYDKNIRDIKAKGEITKIGDDDGLDKGIQTEESWIMALKELKLEDRPGEMSPTVEEHSSSRITSSRSSVDTGVDDLSSPPQTPIPPTKSPSSILSTGQTFLSNLLHHQKSRNAPSSVPAVPGVMQKSKSSSSVVHQGSRLVAKTIWKSRSKSQNRATPSATSAWTPQGNCQWTNVTGRTIYINDTTLLQLSDIERRVLQKVALAKLQALNLGVSVRIPSESVASTVQKPKRRAYLLKRKAITTGFFDSKTGKDDKEKSGEGGGMVFGVPLGQCVENERLARGGKADPEGQGDDAELRRKPHHGSRTSFSSLVESAARGEKGSSESLTCPALSMPGLLDTLSVGSALDLSQDQGGVPNIVSCCLRHLENHGLHTLGIFRVSSSKKRVRQLREEFDGGKDMTMEPELCPHDVATLLKEYFRDLPDPLLCKDLYQAFIQTQRIRNRRLQHEALQHLLQLLPVPNRDTLWALLVFLSAVARNCEDHRDTAGEWVVGNKMDSNNLATLFAPNILHSCKTSNKDELSTERTEERSDAINVIRALIDNYSSLYQVSAELLDEVYVHMMDSHPEALDQIMQRRDLATEETEDLEASTLSEDRLHVPGDSQESLVSCSTEERKVWSREAFTHETAGMGGPDLEMRPRKERGRERVTKKQRWRDEQGGRRRLDSDQSTPSRRTSSTSYPDESLLSPDDPMLFRGKAADSGVITASLKIPMPASSLTLGLDDDIPFIEDSDRQQLTLGVARSSTSSQRMSSDSSQASTYLRQMPQYRDSAVGSSVSPAHSSYSSGGVFSSSPSWASSPPTSPDPTHPTVNYLPDNEPTTARITFPTKKTPDPQQRVTIQRVTIKSAGEVQQVKQTYSRQESATVTTQPQERRRSKESPYQRLTASDLSKSASSSTMSVERTIPVVREGERTTVERSVTPSISSIGGAVMRSKTADIERMLKIQTASKQTKKTTGVTVSSEEEKKIKRKYTDSRHLTRTLPQSTEALVETEASSSSRTTEQRRSGVVYKRRELISSEPKERRGFFN